MGALLKLILCFYVLSLIFSMFVALICFIIDVFRWHDNEKKVEIISSSDWKEVEDLGRNGSNNSSSGYGKSERDSDRISGAESDRTGDNERGAEPLVF